jgi:hypothetical protein
VRCSPVERRFDPFDQDLLLSLSVEGDDWLVADPLDVSGAAPWEAEDDDAESDDGAGDAGMADFEDEEAELVGGGSDDVLCRSPQAPSSKAAVIAIDSAEGFIAFPFMDVHGRTINAARFAPIAQLP